MYSLITFDRSTRSLGRSESESDPLLDEPMVLLDDVVQIRRRSATTASTEFTGLLQLCDGAGVGRMPVHVDHSRPLSPAGQGETQEQLRCDQITLRRQQELDGFASRIDGAIDWRSRTKSANGWETLTACGKLKLSERVTKRV